MAQTQGQRDNWEEVLNVVDYSTRNRLSFLLERNETTTLNHLFAIQRPSDLSTHQFNPLSSADYVSMLDRLLLPQDQRLFRRYGFQEGELITDEADHPIEALSLPYYSQIRNIVLEETHCDPPFSDGWSGCFSALHEWTSRFGNGTQESLPIALRCRIGMIPQQCVGQPSQVQGFGGFNIEFSA